MLPFEATASAVALSPGCAGVSKESVHSGTPEGEYLMVAQTFPPPVTIMLPDESTATALGIAAPKRCTQTCLSVWASVDSGPSRSNTLVKRWLLVFISVI